MRLRRPSSAPLALLFAALGTATGCGSAPSDTTQSAGEDLSQSQCATAKPWAPNTAYKIGDVVSFEGVVYVVIQAHTSLSVWPPNIVPALYQVTSCSSAGAPAPTPAPTSGPAPTPAPAPTTPPAPTAPPATGGGATGTAPASLVFSSYKDTSISMNFNTNVISTKITGSLTPLATELPAAGGKTVSLAFATGECGSENWGGTPGATFASTNVPLFTKAGLKYIVSTGGADGVFTCGTDAGMEAFIGEWASSDLIGIDFDIEAGQTPAIINALVQRIHAAHQAHPGLRFSLTLATLAASQSSSTTAHSLGASAPDSFNVFGDNAMSAVKSILGFNGSASTWPSFVTVNLMTMDYGSASPSICVVSNGACEMGQSAIQAAFNLRDKFGVPLTNIEITPMIGGNDNQAELFTLSDADTVAAFAIANKLAGVHYWSYDRDIDCAPGPASATCNTIGNAGTHGYLDRFLRDGLH
jgi:chitinase